MKWQRQSSTSKLILIGVMLAGLVVLMPPYSAAFIGDDYFQLGRVTEFMTRPFTAYKILSPFWQPWYYRPWQNLWFLFNRLFFGFHPFGFYWQQMLVHTLAVSLVYRVSRQFKLSRFSAAAAAALFGLHGHWFDVVTWLSSIAIVTAAVFSLLAVSFYLEHLKRPSARRALPLTLLFSLLTLFTHEEGFLLPLFLFTLFIVVKEAMTLWPKPKIGWNRLPKADLAALGFLLLVDFAYLSLQFSRPNDLISVADTPGGGWLAHISIREISLYLGHWFIRSLALVTQPPPLTNLTAVTLLTGLGMAGLAWWGWRGSRVVRLGLFWLGLHAGFIYWALWVQKPGFFAGRHIYQGMIGLILALGAGLDQLLAWPGWKRTKQQRRQFLVGAGVTAVLIYFASTTQAMQQIWLKDIDERDRAAEAQLKQLLPEVTPETRIFANRFVPAAGFAPETVMVWYNQPVNRPGGSLQNLRRVGRATRDTYLFDYENGRLFNLMPELQQHDETIFIWSQEPEIRLLDSSQDNSDFTPPKMTIVDDQGEYKLALPTQPIRDGWLSWQYTLSIPADSSLHLSVRGPDSSFRIRLTDENGIPLTLFEGKSIQGGWQEVILPLAPYWHQTVTLELISTGEKGYWGNPRIVVN